ncbi:MAG: hypothetical protein AVDCRST_MAG23-1983 [uncultured Sphingosinicella sp.]|uniref:Uncharacterized protein n=1 Tax=uncultured Sphingosinicella sp. TaxID=478748 RepID=A0A6J4U763_9SPHN|nr:MAG: hypothetical protein AVDCRST_MAG23-1983 [uncultured Sphingosinicella sp.]
MGTFYRSKHELVFVYKVGTAPHTNISKGRDRVLGGQFVNPKRVMLSAIWRTCF